jgi:fructoselysine-6-P-deglycase FrlB-like protein
VSNNFSELLKKDLEAGIRYSGEQYYKTKRLAGENVIVTGAGDSYAAALIFAFLYRGIAIPIDPLSLTKEKLRIFADKKYLMIAISVGGKSIDIIEKGQEYSKIGGRVVSVTGNKDSPLAKLSEEIVLLVYTSTAMGVGFGRQLILLSALSKLAGGPLPEKRTQGVLKIGGNLPRVHVGTKEGFGTALYGALKDMEIFGKESIALEIGQYIHAPIYAYGNKETILYLPSEEDKRITEIKNTLQNTLPQITILPVLDENPWQNAFNQTILLQENLIQEVEEKNIGEPAFLKHPKLVELTKLIYI